MEDQLAALRRKLKAADTTEEEDAIIEEMVILRVKIAAEKSDVAAVSVSGGSDSPATAITGIPTQPLEVATSLHIPSAASATAKRSAPSGRWFKFDDERVTKEDVKRALEEQYNAEQEFPQRNPGYNNTPFKFTKCSNAYVLMYIRVSDKDKILCDVNGKDIAQHLRHQGPIVEGPQPMKVVSVDNAGTVGIRASYEPPPSRFIWTIENFSRLKVKMLYSEAFTAGGCKWRVLIFPKGNNVDFLSMYLVMAESSFLPYGWNKYAQFSLSVLSQKHDKLTMKKDTQHEFNKREREMGFTSFMPLSDLYDPNKGYIMNDTCVIQADVAVQKSRNKEQEEKEKDEKIYKEQPHLYSIIKVARDEDLREQIGKDLYFDLVDHDKVRNFRIKKQMPFNHFKEEVAKEFGIPVQFQRFWIWAKRQNGTYRPNRPLTTREEAQRVGTLAHNADLKLFLEVEFGLDLLPIPPVEKKKDDIMLFFKLYDPEKEELRYVGKLFVKIYAVPIEIQAKLNEMAGFAPNEEIEFFEEIKFEPSVMCDRIDKRASFRSSEIEDGDIVCFQKQPPTDCVDKIRFPEVPSYLEYMKNSQVLSMPGRKRQRCS